MKEDEIMARIYKGAAALIKSNKLTDEQVTMIQGSGSGGAIKAEDVTAFLKKGTKSKKRKASQQDIIRAGLLKGKTSEQIVAAVLEVMPDSKIKAAHVSWTKGNEKRKNSNWWKVYQKTLK